MGQVVLHEGIKIVGTLPDGTGDDVVTINSDGEFGKISSIDTSNFLTTTLASARIIVGDGSNVAQPVVMSGDTTISNTGVVAIASGVIVDADVNAAAAIALTKLAATTASRLLVSDGSGFITPSAVTATEAGYLSGVSSAIQTQLGTKVTNSFTASRALVSNGGGNVAVSAVTSTELGYVSGVTSALQGQLDDKLTYTDTPSAGDILYFDSGVWNSLAVGAEGEVLTVNSGLPAWDTGASNGVPAGGTTDQYLSKVDGTDYNTQWVTLTASKITDVSASASELNILDGATLSTTELNYVDGVTSAIQTQLDLKLDRALSQNSLFVGNASDVAVPLATGANGYVLTSASGVPTWVAPGVGGTVTSVAVSGGTTGLTVSGSPVTTSGTITLSGTLVAANGGTGQSSYAVGDLLYASGATALSKLASGTTGYVLTATGAASAPVWSQSVLFDSTTLSSANILDLFDTPIELIAAPGAGKIIDVLSIEVFYDYDTTPYATTTDFWITYGALGGAELHDTGISFAGSADLFTKLDLITTEFSTASRVNTPISAYAQGANPEDGAGNIKIFIAYRIITI